MHWQPSRQISNSPRLLVDQVIIITILRCPHTLTASRREHARGVVLSLLSHTIVDMAMAASRMRHCGMCMHKARAGSMASRRQCCNRHSRSVLHSRKHTHQFLQNARIFILMIFRRWWCLQSRLGRCHLAVACSLNLFFFCLIMAFT